MDTQVFFTECRDILDAHHDRRERIIKVSRDITAQSKKMIFALHRATQCTNKDKYKEAELKQNEILQLFRKLAVDIQGSDYHRYARSFSGGFEEFIEAIAFHHFLLHQTVITKEEVDDFFKDGNQQWLEVKAEDYILGLGDFTGELMRYAIYIVSSGGYDQAMIICKLLRKLDIEFELVAASCLPQLFKKMGALKGSIKKVEQACYNFQIRGSEYPKEVYLSIIKDHQDKYEQQQQS